MQRHCDLQILKFLKNVWCQTIYVNNLQIQKGKTNKHFTISKFQLKIITIILKFKRIFNTFVNLQQINKNVQVNIANLHYFSHKDTLLNSY